MFGYLDRCSSGSHSFQRLFLDYFGTHEIIFECDLPLVAVQISKGDNDERKFVNPLYFSHHYILLIDRWMTEF